MERGAGRGAPPDDGRDGAEDEFGPDAGDRDEHALEGPTTHYAFGGVGIEGRREVGERKAHRTYAPTEMPAGNAMRRLVDGGQEKSDAPEDGEIEPGLVSEVKELQRVAADFAPVQDKDAEGDGKPAQSQEREPPREHETDLAIKPDEEVIRIESGEGDEAEVAPLVLLLLAQRLAALVRRLLQERDVLLLGSFVPELDGFQVVSEFAQFFEGNRKAGFLSVGFGDFFEAALAVEEANNVPGLRREVEHGIDAGNVDADDRAAVYDVLLMSNVRVQAWTALRDDTGREIGQRDVECPAQVHGWAARWRTALMPGRSRPGGPVTSTKPSKVPLAGSTTGLSSTTDAVCCSPGKSGISSGTRWPSLTLPRNFSGRVNRMRRGDSAVTQKRRSPRATCWPSRM